MNTRLSLYLILGCNGLENKVFKLCNKTENIILNFDNMDLTDYTKVIFFLDSACEMVDYEMSDYNKIANVISILHTKYKVFNQESLLNIQKYIKMHKDCGLYLILSLQEDYDG